MFQPEQHTTRELIGLFFGSATVVAFIGHAVNTFPVPENQYGRWLLGVIQWAVGQRMQATNTKAGVMAPKLIENAEGEKVFVQPALTLMTAMKAEQAPTLEVTKPAEETPKP